MNEIWNSFLSCVEMNISDVAWIFEVDDILNNTIGAISVRYCINWLRR